MTKISIVTPTANRARLLEAVFHCVTAQDHRDWEWLVDDDGTEPCPALLACTDPRIRYNFAAKSGTLGEKRNRLIDRAVGDIVIHFDDDDYYAPRYLSTMLATLERGRADFVKLSSFFLYHVAKRRYGYWELSRVGGHHFVWGRQGPECEISNDGVAQVCDVLALGFGFSYAFRRKVWEQSPFPDKDFGEDQDFATCAVNAGLRCTTFDDRQGLCLHILHAGNMSKAYPQYLLPDFIGERMFPRFDPAAYGAAPPAAG